MLLLTPSVSGLFKGSVATLESNAVGCDNTSIQTYQQQSDGADRPSPPAHFRTPGLCGSCGLPRSWPACARQPKRNGTPGWPKPPLDGPVVLLQDIIEVRHRPVQPES